MNYRVEIYMDIPDNEADNAKEAKSIADRIICAGSDAILAGRIEFTIIDVDM